MQRTWIPALFTSLAWLWSAGAGVAAANSDDAPGLADPQPADAASLDARVAELEHALADVRPSTRTYYASWLAAMSVMAVGQAAIGLSVDDRAVRESMFLGAGLTVAGIGLLLITPSPGRYGADELRGMPASSLADKRAKLMRGEQLLRGEAATDRFRRAWYQHVLIAALGGGVGVWLGVRYPDQVWTAAVPSAIGTIAIAELQIWTSPKASIDHWNRYRAGGPSLAIAPAVAPQMLGVSLQARF